MLGKIECFSFQKCDSLGNLCYLFQNNGDCDAEVDEDGSYNNDVDINVGDNGSGFVVDDNNVDVDDNY